MNNAIVWRGKSVLDSSAILLIAKEIGNGKTKRVISFSVVAEKLAGELVKFSDIDSAKKYYLAKIASYIDAVCHDDCEHKRKKTCYAHHNYQNCGETVAMARNSWNTLQSRNGFNHRALNRFLLSDAKRFRLMVSGSTSALPVHIARSLIKKFRKAGKKPLGYVENWRTRPDLMDSHMASCFNLDDKREAESLGWRAFLSAQVELLNGEMPENAILCPGSKAYENLKSDRIGCEKCGLCNGGKGKSIINPRHANGDWAHNKSLINKGLMSNELKNSSGKTVGLIVLQ
jgi:hypothetical protein